MFIVPPTIQVRGFFLEFRMGKKPKPGLLHIFTLDEDCGKTFIISLMDDETKLYYASINKIYSTCHSEIWLPPGNYIIKIIGKDKEKPITITEGAYIHIDWRL